MTSVFVIGASGVGKTTLIDKYIKESNGSVVLIKEIARKFMQEKGITQDDLANERIFWTMQVEIAKRQLEREAEIDGGHYISDRCVVDALVYAAMLKPECFPLLSTEKEPNCPQNQVAEKILKSLIGESIDTKNTAKKMERRYQQSLVVLVHPHSSSIINDSIRKMMNEAEIENFTLLCRRLLLLLRVPYFELRETELGVRAQILERAIKEHTLPSPLSTLEHFQNLTSKKVDAKAAEEYYHAINLPFYMARRQKHTEIPCISLSLAELRQSLFSPGTGRTNRFLDHNDHQRMFLIEFAPEVPSKVVKQVLSAGVRIQGCLYSFLGCSASGLKSRKCFMWRGTASDAEEVRENNGRFASLKTIPKQIARFSLLLTNVVPTNVSPSVLLESDVEGESGSNFTDGCGAMSHDIAASLFRATRSVFTRKTDKVVLMPSVVQFRSRGFKGVLALNSKLPHGTIVIRPSMVKFSTERFPYISVCEYSRPFSFGHLNRQFILLLSGLGVPDDVFIKLQREHFNRVRRMLYSRDDALMLLEWCNRAHELVDDSSDGCCDCLQMPYAHLRPLQKRLVTEAPKLRILVPESRTLFGVAETPQFCLKTGRRLKGVLKPGECMVRLTMRGAQPFSLHGHPVLVSKNPCYLLGDIRVLWAVSAVERPELADLERDLVDCIVFPIEGQRPHSEEIAGSDLDGDQYFVCWDAKLIPSSTRPPYGYPAHNGSKFIRSPENLSANEKTAHMVEYFSIQNKVSSKTGRVDSLYRAWADLRGVNCAECERLGQLFSRVVDSAKSGEAVNIPEALAIPKEKRPVPTATSKFVWQRMEFAANEFVVEQEAGLASSGTLVVQSCTAPDDSQEEDSFLLGFVARNHLAMSEFTKFRLIMKHLQHNVKAFFSSQFAQHVNFSLFSPSERGSAVVEFGVPPNLLGNAFLCYSTLVGSRSAFLEKYNFDAEVQWQLVWRTRSDKENLIFPVLLTHTLRYHTDVMLLIETPGSVVVGLQFSRRVMRAGKSKSIFTENKNGCFDAPISEFMVHAYFISGSFGFTESYLLKDPRYRMDLSPDEGLQLYRGERGLTFIHLKIVRQSSTVSLSRNRMGNRGSDDSLLADSDIPTVILSVDLTRFNRRILGGTRRHPLVRKVPVFSMEMFAYKRKSDFRNLRSQATVYLDILLNDHNDRFRPHSFENEAVLEDSDSIDDLIPSAERFLEVYEQLSFDLGNEKAVSSCWLLLQKAYGYYVLCDSVPRSVLDTLNMVESVFTKLTDLDTNDLFVLVNTLPLFAGLGIDYTWWKTKLSFGSIQVCDFVQIVRQWDLWSVMPNAYTRLQVFSGVKASVDKTSLDPLHTFVFENACEQLTALLAELNEADNCTSRGEAVATVSNLRLDPSQPAWKVPGDISTIRHPCLPTEPTEQATTEPTITLYRVQGAPLGVNFATGEFVCLTRQTVDSRGEQERNDEVIACGTEMGGSDWTKQQYDELFPPLNRADKQASSKINPRDDRISKSFGVCFGRIVSYCEAPFSVSIKLIAPSFGPHVTPEVLLQCLHHRRPIYWQLLAVPANVVTHIRNVDAIHSFLKPTTPITGTSFPVAPEILPYLFPMEEKVEEMSCFDNEDLPPREELVSMNDRQKDAVLSTLTNRVSLVHGPPGTGKTTTSVEIMKQILERSDHRVLVCAETNLAVDNMALRFLERCETNKYGPIRVGRNLGKNQMQDDSIKSIALETLVYKQAQPKISGEFFFSRHRNVITKLFNKSRIVFTTCSGAGDPILSGQRFHSVIMDEASMTTEPGALCPITHGCRHLVLIGDHKQLGPHAAGGEGTCVSLFERLALRNNQCKEAAMIFLNEQHRMHPTLCSFPSRMFYDGLLVTADGVETARNIPYCPYFSTTHVCYIDVHGGREERVGGGSWFNSVEIDRVMDVLRDLLIGKKNHLSASKITILTFYRAQQMKIKERLKCWKKEPPEVCSVDGFQGRENDVVIVSTVRSRDSLGFCGDERRVNVLLTRAKCGLIVLGSRNTLEKSPLWSKWLREMASR